MCLKNTPQPTFRIDPELNAWQTPLSVAIAIGSPKSLAAVATRIPNPNIDFPNIIAADVRYLDKANFSIGKGNIISVKSSFSCNVHIGDFNIFNGSISIGHDARIGNYNVFMPNTKISGEVIIEDRNLFGASSFVLQQVKIGSSITLSPLSALLRKPKDGNVYVGNPAIRVKY
jgi:acetyltransferase-like isoleucine patch superfamily enzyme